MPTPFLFTGEETTLLNQELTKRKQSFLSKYGESGLFERKGDEEAIPDLQNSLLGGGFFATKKLIIIHGIPKDSITSYAIPASVSNRLSPWIQKHRDDIPQDHVVVFVCRKPDKRTSNYKTFSKLCETKEFKLLSSSQRFSYTKKILGTLLSDEQCEMLVHSSGSAMGTLQMDIQKIQLYMEWNTLQSITDEQLSVLLSHSGNDNAFALLDLMVQDPSKAVNYLDLLRDQGSDTFQTMGMLYRGIKILIGMIDSREQGFSSSKEIASRIKAPPFTISKFGKYKADIIQKKDYRSKVYIELVTLDYALKTGTLPAESFRISVKQLLSSN